MPAVRTSRVTLASFASRGAAGPAAAARPVAGGQRTDQVSGPTLRCPGSVRSTGTSAVFAIRRTNSAWSGGSSRVVVSMAPTARPRRTPGSPATWSAWKWVRTTRGTRVTPSARRHRSASAGSGPASTTTALPSPADSTSASPWPTSQTASRQSGGGHPVTTLGSGAGRTTASRRSRPQAAQDQGRRIHRGRVRTTATEASASSRPPVQPLGQVISAPGRAAPARATVVTHSTGQPAAQERDVATGGANGAVASARKPSTVAGATAASARRLHGTATRLTRAASTATTGPHTACAAAAAARGSASRSGTRRLRSAALQRGASVSSEAVADTESRKP